MIGRRGNSDKRYTIKLADLTFISSNNIKIKDNWAIVCNDHGEIIYAVPSDSIVWVSDNATKNR